MKRDLVRGGNEVVRSDVLRAEYLGTSRSLYAHPYVYGWALRDLVELGEMNGRQRQAALALPGVKVAALVLWYLNPMLLGPVGVFVLFSIAAILGLGGFLSGAGIRLFLIIGGVVLVALLASLTALSVAFQHQERDRV